MENTLRQLEVSRLPAQVDDSAMGRPHIDTHSRKRDRALVAIFAIGAFDLCQDSQRDEHPLQPRLRYELLDRNPVQWVRESAKRKNIRRCSKIEEVQSPLS